MGQRKQAGQEWMELERRELGMDKTEQGRERDKLKNYILIIRAPTKLFKTYLCFFFLCMKTHGYAGTVL